MENIDKKVDEKLKTFDQEKKEDILANFENFKQYLGGKVELGEKMGLSEERLAQITEKVANYLAKNEDPKNREEYVLQQLWSVGEKEERHMLAHMLLRLVKKDS
ncbi:DUF3243 domain-containing protein [Planococcus shenhongbingii]|uniref:DUF3243 domain-containing protein n=1 Tax=Planococcus shenhongbingii TaxID=3058398 RepID=A0ABT8NAK6_9BACL|nr:MULTISPECIES: DUF3243 domain-containing protein [unclassified Planococcus (in: firmicutes)]MDN7244918.1 DUF3243 domain-containing protein [Planococcus sp. N017]WKA58022.1 DUF3243 domain-containing protein [Planococcus sp. N016]